MHRLSNRQLTHEPDDLKLDFLTGKKRLAGGHSLSHG